MSNLKIGTKVQFCDTTSELDGMFGTIMGWHGMNFYKKAEAYIVLFDNNETYCDQRAIVIPMMMQ